MKYVGSKRRIAREILSIVLRDRKPGQWYVEPFVGGANTLMLAEGPRLGGDTHPWLIGLLRNAANGWLPPRELPEERYRALKETAKFYHPLELGVDEVSTIAYAGFSLSYGGKWFGGYRRDRTGKTDKKTGNRVYRDYSDEAYRAAVKEFNLLLGARFELAPYDKLTIPENSIIYCDPPYEGTLGYAGAGSFDHQKFWQWCRDKAEAGHKVYVSEYQAPDDFVRVWSRELATLVDNSGGSKKSAVEALFVHKSQI
ncbi:DNA adenine methylase protein [Rhizobium phage RHph_X2_26]|nr:DNA adenine methylase protein [Rhizobium phage RHph_X2_26]